MILKTLICTAICHVTKKKLNGYCLATANISPGQNDDLIYLSKQHNHPLRPFNLDIPLLRNLITEKAMKKMAHSYFPREVYMEGIMKLVHLYRFCK